MAEEFKLPASPYETLVKIIKAFGHSQGLKNNQEIGNLSGVSQYDVSRNSGFLSSIQIIEGGKTKEITEKGKEIALAFEHNIEEEISKRWKEILSENEFIKKITTAIKIRNGMDYQSLQSHIAYSSGQRNNQYVKTGSSTIIELLKMANILIEQDGKLILAKSFNLENDSINDISEKTHHASVKNNIIDDVVKVNDQYKLPNNINVNVEIKIQATISELDELKTKLKSFLNEMRKTEE